jgi:hypothetical protein
MVAVKLVTLSLSMGYNNLLNLFNILLENKFKFFFIFYQKKIGD